MHRANPKRPGAAGCAAIDQRLSADKKVLDNLLVVFHRGTLRDYERYYSGPRRSELVDPEHAVGNADLRIGILEHRVFLADDLGRELGQDLRQPREEALPILRGDVVRDHRAERKDIQAIVRADRQEQLERGTVRLGKRSGHLAQREIFLECSRVELMNPARQTSVPPAPLAGSTVSRLSDNGLRPMRSRKALPNRVVAAASAAQILLCILLIAQIATSPAAQESAASAAKSGSSADAAFRTQAREFIEAELLLYPERATALGDHRYDNQLGDLSADGFARAVVHAKKWLKTFRGHDRKSLPSPHEPDHQFLITQAH